MNALSLGDTAKTDNVMSETTCHHRVWVQWLSGLVGYPDSGAKKLRMCAGGLADDDLHSASATALLRRDDVVLSGQTIALSMDNSGIDYGGSGIDYGGSGILAPQVLRAYNGSVTATPDSAGTVTIATGSDGTVTVRVLGSNLISQPKLLIKYQDEDVGSVRCDFGATQRIRRFPEPVPADPLLGPPSDVDTGWLFDFPQMDGPNQTTPAKVYLKFQVNPSKPDDYIDENGHGNWRFVNGHDLLFRIDRVEVQEYAPALSGDLGAYVYVVDPANSQATTRIIKTGQIPNANGEYDGSAQVIVEGGVKFEDVFELWVAADDLTQKRN